MPTRYTYSQDHASHNVTAASHAKRTISQRTRVHVLVSLKIIGQLTTKDTLLSKENPLGINLFISTISMSLSLSTIRARQKSPCEYPVVVIQLCTPTKSDLIYIASIPLHLLQLYAPNVLHLVELDVLDSTLSLPLRSPPHAHMNDIEYLGLTYLLQRWIVSASYPKVSALPAFKSIGEGILLYHALQLLQDPEAETLRGHLMSRFTFEPVTETDAQYIWWAFQGRPEWSCWLDALMRNIVRFQVLNTQPCGVNILLFLETELLLLDNVQHAQLSEIYERHVAMTPRLGRFRRAVYRIFHGWFAEDFGVDMKRLVGR